MKYLIIGILCNVACLFLSCDKNIKRIDYIYEFVYVYENQLDIPVKVEYHWTPLRGVKQGIPQTKIVDVNAKDSLIDITTDSGSIEIILADCDSVRFVFDNAKALWYFREKETDKPGSVFVTDNYTYTIDTPLRIIHRYKISQEIYNLATELK